MGKLFISYAQPNKEQVYPLAEALGRTGIETRFLVYAGTPGLHDEETGLE
jgi:hypothetical protein